MRITWSDGISSLAVRVSPPDGPSTCTSDCKLLGIRGLYRIFNSILLDRGDAAFFGSISVG